MVKIAPLDDSFLNVFQLQASPVKGQSLQQKEKKRGKREGEKNSKIEKPKDVGHLLICQNFDCCASPSQKVVKCDFSGKKG